MCDYDKNIVTSKQRGKNKNEKGGVRVFKWRGKWKEHREEQNLSIDFR